jgi:hypothetical protein
MYLPVLHWTAAAVQHLQPPPLAALNPQARTTKTPLDSKQHTCQYGGVVEQAQGVPMLHPLVHTSSCATISTRGGEREAYQHSTMPE